MNNLKTAFSALGIILTIAVSAQPQQRDRPAKERLETLKVGFLTNRLNLTTEEAKVFWPVYNRYQDELDQLRKSRRDNLENAKQNWDDMQDADVEKAVDTELNFRQSELDVQKKYHPQFKKVLPIKKVAKLYKAEEDFKRKLLEMIQDRKDDRREDKFDGKQGDHKERPRE